MSLRVAVIGAGPAGIGTAKCLLEEGHAVVVFEKSDAIGGVWNFRFDRAGGVYDTTVYQTSKFVSGFCDFPMTGTSMFPTHEEILKYLHAFVGAFRLQELIRCDCEVEQALPKGGRWEITVRSRDRRETDTYDAIAVCTGMYWEPRVANVRGKSQFGGSLLHSSLYKTVAGLEDKRVVVVGNGVSGMDIAVEASRVAASVEWSFGAPNWIKPRWLGSIPYETGVAHGIHMSREDLLNHWRTWLPEYYEAYSQAGLIPMKAPFGEALGANDDIVRLVAEHRIVRRRSLVTLSNSGCEYEDGAQGEADVVILATGYKNFTFPFFPPHLRERLKVHEEGMDLFQHVFHPELPNCAFVFHVTANAPALPTIELQARWFARLLSRKTRLPPEDEMRHSIRSEAAKRKKRLNKTTYRSNYVDAGYLLRLGELAGALPDKTRSFAEYFEHVRPPSFPPLYRLSGPHSWQGAKHALVEARAEYPLKAHHFGDLKKFALADCTVPDLLDMYRNGQISREDVLDMLPGMEDLRAA